jgi:quinol monooxygenase YgiN
MSQLSSAVSLHPYFQVQAGKVDEFISGFASFIEKTGTEKGCLYYDFTINGDEVFCREAYVDGDAALAHLQNVDENLKQALSISTLTRLEIHGPAAELEKMRAPLVTLSPAYFVQTAGLDK